MIVTGYLSYLKAFFEFAFLDSAKHWQDLRSVVGQYWLFHLKKIILVKAKPVSFNKSIIGDLLFFDWSLLSLAETDE